MRCFVAVFGHQGRSDFSLRAAAAALPMRDAFAVLFFVSVGMLFDPRSLLEGPWQALATIAIVMLAKPLAAVGIVFGLGYPPKVATRPSGRQFDGTRERV